jgi:photosystem II stability/assembly factor-like uncharacterized protein
MTKTLSTILLLCCASFAAAQEPTVYATVISTKLFIVGAPNPQTGLFFQTPNEDTVWRHTGATNIRANGVAFDRSAGRNIIYIASGNGLHKTTNGGESWKIMTGWEITEVLGVTVDLRNGSNVFISSAYGIYKSTDEGMTWKQVHRGFVSAVRIDHSNSSHLFSSTEDGVVESTDGGNTWKATNLSVKRIRNMRQHPINANILFAATEDNGIYRSDNAGKSWTKVEAGIDHTTFYTIAFDPSNPNLVYAGGFATGIYRSTDGGRSWKRSFQGLLVDHIHSIVVDPTKSGRVYAATIGDGVYRSDDGGVTWRNVGLRGSQVWRVAIQEN